MIWWTGLASWEFEFPFPGSLTSTFLVVGRDLKKLRAALGLVSGLGFMSQGLGFKVWGLGFRVQGSGYRV